MELGWEEELYMGILWGILPVNCNCSELIWLLEAETPALKCEDITCAAFRGFMVS